MNIPMKIKNNLAIDGGIPIRRSSFAPWPFFEADEKAAAEAVLDSGKVNYWTGDEGRLFEREFADYVGANHAIAVANGTVALELCLKVLGIGQGDEVIVTSRTFIASASCIVMVGAAPVMADIDPDSQNVTADTLAKVLTCRTKAIIAVHLAGWPCEMDEIMRLAEMHNVVVIEDCAQAHGAVYKGRKVGSLGHMAAFSFCQDKIMTTGGEGGMVTTNDSLLWERAWAFKDHGKSYTAVYRQEHPPGFRWLHQTFGTNWRLTEMQSAIGRVVLRKLPIWLQKRHANASMLKEAFLEIPALRVPLVPEYLEHAYYKFYSFVDPLKLKEGWNRDRIMAAINAEGVPCFSGSCSEIYLEGAFVDSDFVPAERLSVARELGENSLMFLVHPTLTGADLEDTLEATNKVMAHAQS